MTEGRPRDRCARSRFNLELDLLAAGAHHPRVEDQSAQVTKTM